MGWVGNASRFDAISDGYPDRDPKAKRLFGWQRDGIRVAADFALVRYPRLDIFHGLSDSQQVSHSISHADFLPFFP